MREKRLWLYYSLLYIQFLPQCLKHNRLLINICEKFLHLAAVFSSHVTMVKLECRNLRSSRNWCLLIFQVISSTVTSSKRPILTTLCTVDNPLPRSICFNSFIAHITIRLIHVSSLHQNIRSKSSKTLIISFTAVSPVPKKCLHKLFDCWGHLRYAYSI